jgi:hypothetical protein
VSKGRGSSLRQAAEGDGCGGRGTDAGFKLCARPRNYLRGTRRMTCLVIVRKENQESRGCQNSRPHSTEKKVSRKYSSKELRAPNRGI